jgi:2-dehydro-3-deoxygalactonokinase
MTWVAVDWGTTRLRAWAVADDGSVTSRTATDRGMGTLKPAEFEGALLEAIGPWLGQGVTRVVACGMVGARQGWTEAAYRPVPGTPLGPPLTKAPTTDPRLDVRIIPGLAQQKSGPDVMRGEETQIAGYLAQCPGFDGVLCLPGTHSKWAALQAGEVTSFQTVMTGEVFALLSSQSVLRHSVGTGEPDLAAFDAAVSETLSFPETLTARLFGLRAGALLQGLTPEAARGRLSGLLIGAELAATRPWWLGREVALIGAGALSALYARALATQGVPAALLDATDLTLAGLRAGHALWKDTA